MTIEHDKHKPRLAYVPMFPGFYYSRYGDAIDSAMEDAAEQYMQRFESVDSEQVYNAVERHTNIAKMRDIFYTTS